MDATGADMKQRGAMADEFLPALKAIWTTNPVEFHGKFYQIPKSYLNRKPVQKPHPPIYLAAFAPAAMKRLATMADGWNPTGLPLEAMSIRHRADAWPRAHGNGTRAQYRAYRQCPVTR